MYGRTIGNYQVTALLGEGGMGIVYLAHHPAIERKSAIKVLHPELARDPQVVSRFFTEARASNAIRHPNIVEIYDCGTLADGSPYIIMEYLEGETLAARLQRGRLGLREALDLAVQAASALAMAHAKNIVHRDLKPENLFLTGDPHQRGVQQIKILDFGIAKLQTRLEEPPHKTLRGVLMGTPLYMSPEQCLGAPDIDPRSDVYSLGVIVYEMVCGWPPFRADTIGAMINMHLNLPPPPPRSWNPAIPASLEATLLKALEKEPEDRFATMDELLQELAEARTLAEGLPAETLNRAPSGAWRATQTPKPLSALTTLSAAAPPARARRMFRLRRLGKWTMPLIVAAQMVAALALYLVLRAPAPRSAPAVEPPAAQAALPPPVVTASKPEEAANVKVPVIFLDSDPPGASVLVGDIVVGVTPTLWKTEAKEEPADFTFVLDGYRRETIRAIPATGLKLRAKLKRLRRSQPPEAEAPAHPTVPPPEPLDDIKSER